MSSLAEAQLSSAARWAGPLLPQAALQAACRPAAAGGEQRRAHEPGVAAAAACTAAAAACSSIERTNPALHLREPRPRLDIPPVPPLCTGLPWAAAAAAAARQQPVSLGAAAAVLEPASGALRAPPAGGLLRELEQLWADSVRRKRKR